MSADLQWLLLRKNNSFVVKRLPEGPIFSKEHGNLRNLHSHKFSGLANEKTIHIADSPKGIQVKTRRTKLSHKQGIVEKAHTTALIRPRSGPRRALGVAARLTARKGYRPDLRAAVLARVSAIIASQKEPKPAPPKKLRGRKAKETQEST